MRKFLTNLKENNPELFTNKQIVVDPEHQKDISDGYKIGDRCELVEDGHRGEICYIGKIPDLNEGYYVGIRLDEPYGMNDGR